MTLKEQIKWHEWYHLVFSGKDITPEDLTFES